MMAFQIYALGSNSDGQLGIGNRDEKVFNPTPLLGLHTNPGQIIRAIKGGQDYTIILTTDGAMWVTETKAKQFRANPQPPVDASISGVDSFSGSHKFELAYEGVSLCAASQTAFAFALIGAESTELYTQGLGPYGELGRGECLSMPVSAVDKDPVRPGIHSILPQIDPVPVWEPSPTSWIVDIAAGQRHFAAVLADGTVWGWGQGRHGQLGHRFGPGQTSNTCLVPTQIGINFSARRVVCGKDFTYVVGDPESGHHEMLTNNDRHGLKRNLPANVVGWKDVGATWNAVFVLHQDGTVHAWGKLDMGQAPPSGLPPLDQIAVGSEHVLGITKEGKQVIAWGWAEHGNCGNTAKKWLKDEWVEINVSGEVQTVGAGWATSFIVTSGDSAAVL